MVFTDTEFFSFLFFPRKTRGPESIYKLTNFIVSVYQVMYFFIPFKEYVGAMHEIQTLNTYMYLIFFKSV